MLFEDQTDKFEPHNFLYDSMILTEITAFSNHCHKELEIMHVITGKLKMVYEQEIILLEAGDTFIVPPFTNHAFFQPEEECRRLVIEVDLDIIDAAMYDNDSMQQKNRLMDLNMYSRSWEAGIKEEVGRLIWGMHEEYTAQEEEWRFAIKTILCQLVLLMIRKFPCRKATENDRQIVRLRSIIEYIAKHFDHEISLSQCATIAGFSPSYFSRYFRKNMGMTFQDYVKNSKIEKAKWLLLSTNLSIVDICYQSGFADIRTFNKTFKKEVLESPSSYRKNYAK